MSEKWVGTALALVGKNYDIKVRVGVKEVSEGLLLVSTPFVWNSFEVYIDNYMLDELNK